MRVVITQINFMRKAFFLLVIVSFFVSYSAKAQVINAVTTSVPFLMISPDSRAGAMGDVGVATSPDGASQFWNPAKYPFSEDNIGFNISYSPWLNKLVDDIDLAYISGYKKLNKSSAISGSLRYFSLGSIELRDKVGNYMGSAKPNEFAVDVAYSRFLGKKFTGAVSLKYIRSDLTNGIEANGIQTEPGNSVASDVAIFYSTKLKISDYESLLNFGANVSNIGNRISYSESLSRDFIPTNLRFGSSLAIKFDNYNKLLIALDINKLLVPTPAVYETDSTGTYLVAGMDNDRSVVNAMFTSFYDAPGVLNSDGTRNVFLEELREYNISGGLEYNYSDFFFLRGGYFYEHETKGNRKYFTTGIGFKYNVFNLDLSYLIPMTQYNPLQGTLRFSLSFYFDEVGEVL